MGEEGSSRSLESRHRFLRLYSVDAIWEATVMCVDASYYYDCWLIFHRSRLGHFHAVEIWILVKGTFFSCMTRNVTDNARRTLQNRIQSPCSGQNHSQFDVLCLMSTLVPEVVNCRDRMLSSGLNFAIGFFGYPFEGKYQQSITIEADGVECCPILTTIHLFDLPL